MCSGLSTLPQQLVVVVVVVFKNRKWGKWEKKECEFPGTDETQLGGPQALRRENLTVLE